MTRRRNRTQPQQQKADPNIQVAVCPLPCPVVAGSGVEEYSTSQDVGDCISSGMTSVTGNDSIADIWLMDSECCHECGCILNYGEWFMCDDCHEDQRAREDQDYYDGWDFAAHDYEVST